MVKKIWISLLMGMAMLLGCSLHVSAAEAVLYDESGRLSKEDYALCMGYLQDAANETGMNVGVILGSKKRSEYTIESLAAESYDELFGKQTDGLLYYMDLSKSATHYDFITTRGLGQFYYTNDDKYDRINAIFDEVVPYLYPTGSEDIPGAIDTFAWTVKHYYEQGIPDHYYVYDDVYDEYSYVKNGEILTSPIVPYIDWEAVVMMAFFGLIVGLITAFIVFLCVKRHYKFKVSLSPTAYINRKNLVFHSQYDNLIRTYTTKTKIESGSGGGGRSGGRSGGGRSSGGRGGGGRRR